MFCPESIVLLIHELHHRTSELSQILFYDIMDSVAGQSSVILNDFYISDSIYVPLIHIPQCRVTKKLRIVMKKLGRSLYFSKRLSINIYQLRFLGIQKANKAIRFLFFLRKERRNA